MRIITVKLPKPSLNSHFDQVCQERGHALVNGLADPYPFDTHEARVAAMMAEARRRFEAQP